MACKPLTAKELAEIAERRMNESDSDQEVIDPYHNNDDSDKDENYDPSDSQSELEYGNVIQTKKWKTDNPGLSSSVISSSSKDEKISEEPENGPTSQSQENPDPIWSNVDETFRPRKQLPCYKEPVVLANVYRGSSELDVFFQMFPKSLFMYISQNTNRDLKC